jgi:CelD/BcsL family acetyltransferase involved in cellulose biosynthesis
MTSLFLPRFLDRIRSVKGVNNLTSTGAVSNPGVCEEEGPACGMPGLRFEISRDEAGLKSLAPHWDRLLDSGAVRTPFMRWDWMEIWWRHFSGQFRPAIGAVWTADGEVVAIVPFMIGGGTVSARRHLRHLTFLAGLGEVVAEGLDLMVRPGFEPVLDPLLDRLFAAIREDWDLAHFGFLDTASPHYDRLRRAINRHASDLQEVNAQASPVARFDEGGWDTYLMQRTGNFRKKYKRIVAESTRDYTVTFHEAETAEQAVAMMETLTALHGERWTADQSLFLQPRTRSFHAELAARWAGQKRVMLLVMAFDGTPVAANYAFIEGARLWDYQGGWKVEHIELSPSKLIIAENIRRAMQRGIQEYDLLPGDLEYKNKWAKEHRFLVDLEACNPTSFRAKLFRSMRSVKRSISKLIHGES